MPCTVIADLRIAYHRFVHPYRLRMVRAVLPCYFSWLRREHVLGWDRPCTVKASDLERRANAILQILKEKDKIRVYDAAPRRKGYDDQLHSRVPADHFLSNVDLIPQTDVFQVARRMQGSSPSHPLQRVSSS
jgi:hypothetical protein